MPATLTRVHTWHSREADVLAAMRTARAEGFYWPEDAHEIRAYAEAAAGAPLPFEHAEYLWGRA
jgi:hypothetical protein